MSIRGLPIAVPQVRSELPQVGLRLYRPQPAPSGGRTADDARGVIVTLSPAARELLARAALPLSDEAAEAADEVADPTDPGAAANESVGSAEESGQDPASKAEEAKKAGVPTELSPEEQVVVAQLRVRDQEVRAHERAHVAAAGGLAGSPQYTYQTGPDGRRYAVGGSVSIDLSPGGTPEETLARAERVRAAATAPAEPSGADLAIAARASQMIADARLDITMEAKEAAAASVEAAKAVEAPTSVSDVDAADEAILEAEASIDAADLELAARAWARGGTPPPGSIISVYA